jgi:hypothetical protein
MTMLFKSYINSGSFSSFNPPPLSLTVLVNCSFAPRKTLDNVTFLECAAHWKAIVSRILFVFGVSHTFQGGNHVMTMATTKSTGPYSILPEEKLLCVKTDDDLTLAQLYAVL